MVAGIDFAAAAFLDSAVFSLDNDATLAGLSIQVWMTLALLVALTPRLPPIDTTLDSPPAVYFALTRTPEELALIEGEYSA